MDGVVKLDPEANIAPPVALAYQFSVPPVAAALNVTLPVSQRPAGVVEVIVCAISIVAITAVLVDVHVPFVAST